MKRLNCKFLLLIIILFFIQCSHKTDPFGPDIGSSMQEESEILIVNSLMIDDFKGNNIGGIWNVQNDSANGGNSTISFAKKTNIYSGITNRYIWVQYTLGPNYQYRYVFLQNNFNETNLINYNGLKFLLRGSGNKLRIMIRSDSVAGSNYDDFGYVINQTPNNWTEFIIKFSDFNQEGWGTPMDKNEVLRHLNKIQFKASSMISGESGWFEVDNVSFVTLSLKR